jgi:predicted nucleic acid-binding protein
MAHSIVVADTSVVINFLKIDRMDVIGACPRRFLATDHVAAEIADSYPEQQVRYQAAVRAQHLEICKVVDPVEVALFASLKPGQRLGTGECSAIAVAINRRFGLAIDDSRAVKRALREAGLAAHALEVLRTQDVMLMLLRAKVLDVAEADGIKQTWAQRHRFRIKANSFADLLDLHSVGSL